MTWSSDIYPGVLVYEPLGDRDMYWIIWRTDHGDFVRGVIGHFDLMKKGETPPCATAT